MSQQTSDGSWIEYRRLILQELQVLHTDNVELKNHIADLKAAVAVLQFKSGLWGFVAGAIPSVSALAYMAINK